MIYGIMVNDLLHFTKLPPEHINQKYRYDDIMLYKIIL